MYRFALAVSMAAFLAGPAIADTKEPAKDGKKDSVAAQQEKLAGTWKLEKEIRDGAEQRVEDIQLTFAGDKVTLKEKGNAMESKLKLDPSKSPAQMDVTEGDVTIQAIYEIDGDTLRIAFIKDGDGRPTKFESKPGSKVTLATLKRVKK